MFLFDTNVWHIDRLYRNACEHKHKKFVNKHKTC